MVWQKGNLGVPKIYGVMSEEIAKVNPTKR